MLDARLIAFIGIALVLTLTPGADTMLVVRSVLARGPRAGVATTLGICTGLFVHATASALGLSIFLMRSATAFQMIKAAGALYLAYLGARSLWSAWKGGEGAFGAIEGDSVDLAAAEDRVGSGGLTSGDSRDFRDGLLCNVLNPKVAVFYLAFLPQFISPGDPVFAKSILMASIHFAMGIVWLTALSIGLGRIRPLLARSSVRRGLEATTGALLVAFAARLAFEAR